MASYLRNRDAEAKLMANEEGWEVGTWYGHPIYKVNFMLIPFIGFGIVGIWSAMATPSTR